MQESLYNLIKPAQTVIYTTDMEPITVVDMRPEWYSFLERNGRLRVPVAEPFSPLNANDIDNISITIVEIVANLISKGRDRFFILTASNEINALLMDSSFLPGQTKRLNEERLRSFQRGFSEGFMRAARILK